MSGLSVEYVLRAAKSAAQARGLCEENDVEYVEFPAGYKEPGYSGNPVFGNWNPRNGDFKDTRAVMPRLGKILEEMGFETEWCDEWATCGECYGAVRTSPDCYSWEASYYMGDGWIICRECIEGNTARQEEIIQEQEDNTRGCVPSWIDLEEHGYVKQNDRRMQTGFHRGMNDDPTKIAEQLRAAGCKRLAFQVDGVSQFYSEWSWWLHESELHRIRAENINTRGFSPSAALEATLKKVPAMAQVPGAVVCHSLDLEKEEVHTRIISAQQFIEGGIK